MCLDALTQIRYTRRGVRWEADELELVLQLVPELVLELELGADAGPPPWSSSIAG
jgi:hypothetical protein